jgi:hypothetical protein
VENQKGFLVRNRPAQETLHSMKNISEFSRKPLGVLNMRCVKNLIGVF